MSGSSQYHSRITPLTSQEKADARSATLNSKDVSNTPLWGPGCVFDCFRRLPEIGLKQVVILPKLQYGMWKAYTKVITKAYLALSLYERLAGGHERPSRIAAAGWAELSISNSHSFCAMLLQADAVRRMIDKQARESADSLLLRQRTLTLLSKALQDPRLSTHESTLRAVSALAYTSATMQTLVDNVACPRQSILKTWSNQQIYSQFETEESHELGLETLLRLKGGLTNVKHAMLSYTIN